MTEPLTSALEPTLLDRLAEGVARGEYNLLLGAGASAGATGDGRPLPLGDGLANDLTVDFSLPVGSGPLVLTVAYEGASSRRDASNRTLDAYLADRFTRCEPARWHSQITEYSWKRLWTLNIDDTIEQAYARSRSPRQVLRSLSWKDLHSDPDAGELQIVHLHGKASAPGTIVFSILEYLQAARAQEVWHRIFADHFLDHPFIILGASLTTEVDLAEVVRRGSGSLRTRGRPSLYVAKTIEPLQREFVVKHGLIPVETTADDLLRELQPYVRRVDATLKALVGEPGALVPHQAQTFLEQFAPLRLDAQRPRNYSDFYQGYDPSWYDILLDKDALFEAQQEVVGSLARFIAEKPTSQRLELIHGPWGTGKSTALYRVGRELIRSGQDTYLFRGESALDAEATAWWLKRRPDTVLLFDGVADIAPELGKMLSVCSAAGTPARLVGAERHQRLRKVRASIPPKALREEGRRFMRVLSDLDIRELIKTLDAHSRLGKITRWALAAKIFYFQRDSGRHLFSAMANLEEGPGFRDRLVAEFTKQDLATSARDLISVVAFAYEFGHPLPVGIASNATGMWLRNIVESVDGGPLSEWLDLDDLGLRLRHRHIASVIVEELLNANDRYRLTQALARSLAPHVNRTTIANRTLPYRIIRHLLDFDAVNRWMKDRALAWYAELHAEYSWNARYWEQRALAHLHHGDLATSRSYAERALDILRDPFTRTTLAYVMLRQLSGALERGEEFNERSYTDASGHLKDALEYGRGNDEFPFSVFFFESLRVLRLLKRTRQDTATVEAHFEEWFAKASASPLTEVEEFARLFDKARKEFVRIRGADPTEEPSVS